VARVKKRSSRTSTKRSPTDRRRSFVLVGGAVVVAALMMVAWFPASAILGQRQALNAASQQLATMKSQDAALAHEQSALTKSADISRLAREEYQLVEPGQRLIQVLPPSGTATAAGSGQAPFPGDPGLTKPVAPSAIALLPTGTTTTTTTPRAGGKGTTASTKATGAKNLWNRIVATLSFWHR